MKRAVVSLLGMGCVALGLSACGGGSDDDNQNRSGTQAGVLGTNPIEGVRWVAGEASGTTDELGAFEFKTGEDISFYIGDILIGTTIGNELIIPADFVANADNSDPTVINIIRFLSSLDDDNDPSNGITITEQTATQAAGETIDFTQTVAAFQDSGNVQTVIANLTSVTSAGSRALLLTEAAINYTADTSVRAALNTSTTGGSTENSTTSSTENSTTSSTENSTTGSTQGSFDNITGSSTAEDLDTSEGILDFLENNNVVCLSYAPRSECESLYSNHTSVIYTHYESNQTCAGLGYENYYEYSDADIEAITQLAATENIDIGACAWGHVRP